MALDWLPTYPARGSRLPSQKAASNCVVLPPSPIPNPAPPTPFNSLVYYVDRERPRSRNPTAGVTMVGPVMEPGLMAAYLPRVVFPSQTPRRPLERAESFVYPWGTQEGVATRMAWVPSFPDHVSRFRQTPVGQSVWQVDMTTILNAAGCVNWTDLSVVNPAMTPEAVTNPTLSAESVSQASFINEEMCDGVLNQALTSLPNFLSTRPIAWIPLYTEHRRLARSVAARAPSFFKKVDP